MALFTKEGRVTSLQSGDNIVIDFVRGNIYIQRHGETLERSKGNISYAILGTSGSMDANNAKEIAQAIADAAGLNLGEGRVSATLSIFQTKKRRS